MDTHCRVNLYRRTIRKWVYLSVSRARDQNHLQEKPCLHILFQEMREQEYRGHSSCSLSFVRRIDYCEGTLVLIMQFGIRMGRHFCPPIS